MKGNKVIAFKNMPTKLPLLPSITLWLFLDRIKADGWVWGCVGTAMAVMWAGAVICVFTQKQTDIF